MPKKKSHRARPASAAAAPRVNRQLGAQRRKQLQQHYAARYRQR